MEKKTAPLSLMLCPEDKRRLRNKAAGLGLTITGFIEKIIREPVIFMDENLKRAKEFLDSA